MITYITELFSTYWENGQIGKLILTILLLIGGMVILLVPIVFVADQIISFLVLKFDTLIGALSVIGVTVYFWNKRRDEKQAQKLEIQTQQAVYVAEVEREIAENNYTIIRQCLFTVLIEMAERFGLYKPNVLSELSSPSRIIQKNGFSLCQFLAMKKDEMIDLALVKEGLQTRLSQSLNAGEFPELSARNHTYNGNVYPILHIDSLTDSGNYIQINVALANDAYCKYFEQKAQARYQNTLQKRMTLHDEDF